MTTTRVRRVEELFQAASELEPDARARFLAEECGSDAEILREVEELLRCGAEAPDAFLRGEGWSVESHLEPGTHVGAYEIVAPIGEGGMGTVYEARQASPRRTIALKVVRPGRMSRSALRRFHHEADVLGALHHPGIAQVHDAGQAELPSAAGTRAVPYFAMELVRGKPLNVHAAGMALDAKLELVARICDAVQHAHQRGIIHRDLKPENILVVEDPSAGEAKAIGQPKILDFGIARAIGPAGRPTTIETRIGHLVGTLAYMSPEQVAGDRHAVDTRSDVYSLGVILYELVASVPPLDVRDLPLLEAARRIREEAPVPLHAQSGGLPAELDWICGRALEKRPQDRYPGAGELAADLRGYLRGEPVSARRHSAFYILRKSLRRHRAAATAVSLFLALLTAFGVVSSVQAARNSRLAAQAQAELTFANIERGRLLGRQGMTVAEEILWPEYLRAPDSPHAFWALWEYLERNPRLASVSAHETAITAAAFAADGAWVATGTAAGEVSLWNPSDLAHLGDLRGAPGEVYYLAVTPGGSLLGGCSDGTIVRWEPPNPEPGARLTGHEGRVSCLDVHPDGRRLLSSGWDGTVRLWDLASESEVRVLIEREELAWSARFSPDGRRIAAGFGAEIELWEDLSDPDPVTLAGHDGVYTCVAFGADGRTLFSGSQDRRLLVWDLDRRAVAEELRPQNGSLRRIWVGRDGSELFVLGLKRLDVLSLPSLERVRSLPFKLHTLGAAVSPTDGRVAIGLRDGELQLWGQTGGGIHRFPGHVGQAFARLSPDGLSLATGDSEGVVRLWDVSTGTLLDAFEDHTRRVRSLRFSPDGRWLATAAWEGELLLRDLWGEAELRIFPEIAASTDQGLDISPDGKLLAATCTAPAFRIWGLLDGGPRVEIPALGEPLVVRFTPDGTRLVTVAREHPPTIRIWDLAGEPVGALAGGPGTPWDVELTPDGETLCAGTWYQDVEVWNVPEGRLVGELRGHDGTVFSIELNESAPDLLASASEDGTVWLWSLALRRNLATLTPFDGADVRSVSLSRDGRTLAVAGEHPDVLVWDLSYAERHLAGNLRRQLDRLGPELGSSVPRDRLLSWEEEVLSRPWPRWTRPRTRDRGAEDSGGGGNH